MVALLSYADIIGMNYIPASAGIVLSAEEQTMAVQAVSCFGFSELWSDYDTYADQIEALVASTQYSLLTTEIPPPVTMSTSLILLPDMASVTSGATPAWTSDTPSSLAGYWAVVPALTADAMFWQFFLAQGKYNFNLTYLRNTGNGKGDIKVYDAANSLISTTSIDMRGAIQRNTVSGGSFDNPTPGRIKMEWLGTGTSGTTFIRPLQRIWINKYAEL